MNISVTPALVGQLLGPLAADEVLALCRDQYTHKHEKDINALANDTKGATKHWLRGKIGVLVDVLWDSSTLQSQLTPLCFVAASQVITEAGATLAG